MKTEHEYAQALRWIADGENLQIRWGKDPRWMELPERNEIVTDEILRGVGDYEFRIKPRTVKIGNREVEAPVLDPEIGQDLWYWQPDADEPKSFTYKGRNTAVSDAISYASYESCVAAHEALVLFIREQLV